MMKSSTAIFSTQGDPFPPPMKSRTHYRPSRPQALSEEQKQTVLSPVRLPHHLSDALSPPDINFLGGSQRFVPGLPESDSSEPFDESWPSSEGSSKTPEQERVGTGVHGGSAAPTNEDSVIARYMERFRSGRPTSRMERSPPQSAMREFWWLQASPDSPDAQRLRPGSGISAGLVFSPQILDLTPPLAEGSLDDSRVCPEDVDIYGLQERARKLILQSESSLSSRGPVSSDGVGSSPSSVSDMSAIRPPTLDKVSDVSGIRPSTLDRVSDVSGIRPSTLDRAPVVPAPPVTVPTPPMRTHVTVPPEEDILYQWRLRRKMEQAREGTLPLSTRNRSPSPPVRIPRQVLPVVNSSEMVYRVPPPVVTEGSHLVAHAQTPLSCCGHVPLASPHMAPHSIAGAVHPHLHLQCDVLPCVHSQQTAPCTEQKPELQAIRPAPPAPPAGTGHIIQPAEKHKTACEQPPHRRSQRKTDRQGERKVKSKGDQSKRTSDKTGPARAREDPPPSSPVHQAMEQVISERLFSPLQSPKPKPKKRATAPPTEKKEEVQPIEIAAHLLEEAEDSDGTEFRDDPLLQVLREQRQSLRSRLWEVDSRLAELEGENNGDHSHPQ